MGRGKAPNANSANTLSGVMNVGVRGGNLARLSNNDTLAVPCCRAA